MEGKAFEPFANAHVRYPFSNKIMPEQVLRYMFTQNPVGFKLCFGEQLLCGALVGEVGIFGSIFPQELRLISGERRFDVQKQAMISIGIVDS